MRTVVGLFEARDKALRAVVALEAAGFHDEDMSLVSREPHAPPHLADDVHIESEAGTATGAATGAALGAVGGALAGAGLLAIPGIGPVIAMGPLVSGIAGAAMGATAGGLLGAMTDEGIPEHEARHYHEAVERGDTLLTVRTPEAKEPEVRAILVRAGMRPRVQMNRH